MCPTARFVGVAGPMMVKAGCESIFDMTRHSAMLLGAIWAAARGIAMLETADRHLRRYPFAAAVVIDSPTLHLPLALRAQAAGVPVMYYIAPQLWAWGANRIHKVRNRTDRVAVILPFEEPYFRDRGVDAKFVGHPLAEQLAEAVVDQERIDQMRSRGKPFVALLPGSRRQVVNEVLPGQLEVAERIAAEFPDVSFGLSVANPQVAPLIQRLCASATVPTNFHSDGLTELIQAADLVLVASGTTALEVAFHHRPMIVMYNASRVFYHLVARWLIRTPHLSLPNILAGRRIVPEFMPYYRSTGPIADTAIQLLKSEPMRQAMVADLEDVVAPFQEGRASDCAGRMLLDMIG